jgi:mono/diheme cytochrome c family protein
VTRLTQPGASAADPADMRTGCRLFAVADALLLVACPVSSRPPPDPEAALVARGEEIFFEETFGGNGRTCGTCHRAEENFSISAAFIATLADDDPLFVAELQPALAEGFEEPALMRRFGLILENLDGFDDLETRFVLRGVPHLLGLRTSVQSRDGPRTGWSGDGAPGDGSLRSFAVGAVIQHFTRTLNRVPGVDFRLPTDEELDALEAFQLSLGRQHDLALPLALRDPVVARGQEIFLDPTLGKCNLCHVNAGATADFGSGNLGNQNFDTGVEDLPDQPADRFGVPNPTDDGLGTPGDGTFNTPPLVEAADTGPFFHDNAVPTLEDAVAFYDGDSFDQSPAGRRLASLDPAGASIELDATQLAAIAAFLRVVNSLENIRQGIELLEQAAYRSPREDARLLARTVAETEDASRVLAGAGLHPEAVAHLERARALARQALTSHFRRERYAREALRELEQARDLMIGSA